MSIVVGKYVLNANEHCACSYQVCQMQLVYNLSTRGLHMHYHSLYSLVYLTDTVVMISWINSSNAKKIIGLLENISTYSSSPRNTRAILGLSQVITYSSNIRGTWVSLGFIQVHLIRSNVPSVSIRNSRHN